MTLKVQSLCKLTRIWSLINGSMGGIENCTSVAITPAEKAAHTTSQDERDK